jgi:hypothetical protein
MSAFADDFRAELEEQYQEVINRRGDGLEKARAQGMSALIQWVQRRLLHDLYCALDTANPGDVDRACARGALALMLLRDASRAFADMLWYSHDGPKEDVDAKQDAAMEAHARALRGVLLPDADFETMLTMLSNGFRRVQIDVSQTGHEVRVTEYRGKDEPRAKPLVFEGATLVAAVTDAYNGVVKQEPVEVPTEPVGQS